ncbi:NAD-dependent epimerase/dehydratase family protein [Dyadobacter tibetensis]|uniref:NAD-dependent epimerase/dehydratase family protein n=1 Tax=Dyadobacter tibetensis TaxID=1211851 RepID=UPI0004725BCF|nr:NAD-dependent epimerase/dehydratase family protein [Dyadobacter tibetensis]
MNPLQKQYELLLRPSRALIADISRIEGDIIILGAGGKMGPSLAKLAKTAVEEAGLSKNIIAVSRFSDANVIQDLQRAGIETISADLLVEADLQALPEAPNVLYLAGTKFGTQGNESFTWAMNSYLPGRVAEKFRNSRIVVFSTGNVYPLTPVIQGGATENSPTQPLGEYAQSCLGRERIFEYSSKRYKTPALIYRLNYANDVSYGVLLELAKSVIAEQPIDLSMGNVNVIWQGDANEIALRSLLHCSSPVKILNVTGPELLSVRWIAEQFGKMSGIDPVFVNNEQPTALLSNASECVDLFGYPATGPKLMMRLIYQWLMEGGATINKKTHFQEREGKY